MGERFGRAITGTRSERRQPTVLFCDLVDFTGLTRRLDPEDLSRVMQAYEGACDRIITRYRGYVYTFEGDGFRVLFGYPEAHEDDAERAVRAGLELIDAVAALEFPDMGLAGLAVRVGIATGLVVVETPDNQVAGGVAARGEAPTLASRLQSEAEPGWVVISQATRTRLGDVFVLDDLGDRELKGYSEHVPAWRVVSEQPSESRYAALRGITSGAMVGRETELEHLLHLWKSAKSARGRSVVISGEPGIGKSRLLERLAELVQSERHYRLRYQCSPFHSASALHPFVHQLSRIADSGDQDTADARLDRLEARLVIPAGDFPRVMGLVADLLSIPAGERYRCSAGSPENLSPEERKEQVLWMLWQQMLWLAEQRPVLILFEDVHWIDPTSLELVESAMERLEGKRVLMVITHRPEFSLSESFRGRVDRVSLASLDSRQSRALVESYSSPIRLPPTLVDQVVDRAGGVPLFVEELTAWVLAALTGRAHDDDGTTDRLARNMSVPATLQDSLMARLDGLGSAKEVAQLGAVIGREFPGSLLRAMWSLDERSLAEGLARLEDAQLLMRRGEAGSERYAFRHALIHDQAYQCLLKSERVRLHARVVEVMETRFPQIVEQDTVVVARHCELAALAEKAVTYWSNAAGQALSRSANREAVHHIQRALAMLDGIDDEASRNRHELVLQIELGAAYQAVRGFASSKAVRCFERARELCGQGDAPARLIDIQRGLLTGYYVRGQHRVSRKMAEEMLALGESGGDPSIAKVGHYLLGASLFWQGRFPEARHEFREALTDHDAAVKRYEQLSFQIDPVVSLEFHQAWVLWMLGYPEQAWTGISRAVELAESRRQPLTLAMALFVLSAIHACCYSGRAHGPRLEQLTVLCAEHDLAYPAACAKFLSGQDLVARGRPEEGLAMIHQGVAAFDEQEAGLGKPWGLAAAALAHLRLGDPAAGLAVVADTLDLVERHGEYQWQAELYRIRGMLLLAQADDDGAVSSFERAVDIAREQSAKSLELRALSSLARLGQARGRPADAPAALLATYAWFREGFLNDDLKEAASLLSQLTRA